MSIRKRTWKTARGEAKEAWVVDYTDQGGKRRLKTFKKKKEADAFETKAQFEITQGTHTPDWPESRLRRPRRNGLRHAGRGSWRAAQSMPMRSMPSCISSRTSAD